MVRDHFHLKELKERELCYRFDTIWETGLDFIAGKTPTYTATMIHEVGVWLQTRPHIFEHSHLVFENPDDAFEFHIRWM